MTVVYVNYLQISECIFFNRSVALGYTVRTLQCNEEPAMRNLIIDGAAGGETK
jgi:hypothetical protein